MGHQGPQKRAHQCGQDVDGQYRTKLVLEKNVSQGLLDLGLGACFRHAHERLRPDCVCGFRQASKPDGTGRSGQKTDDVGDSAAVKRRRGRKEDAQPANEEEKHACACVHGVIGDAVDLIQQVLRCAGVVGNGSGQCGDEANKEEMPYFAVARPVQRVVGRVRRLGEQNDAVGGLFHRTVARRVVQRHKDVGRARDVVFSKVGAIWSCSL